MDKLKELYSSSAEKYAATLRRKPRNPASAPAEPPLLRGADPLSQQQVIPEWDSFSAEELSSGSAAGSGPGKEDSRRALERVGKCRLAFGTHVPYSNLQT